MKLIRPLISFDLETTGLDTKNDRIVELALVKLIPHGDEVKKIVKVARFYPAMDIPPQATKVHGIRNEDVVDAPPFFSVAGRLLQIFEGCDITGYNIIRFDIPFLTAEFKRCHREWVLDERHIIDPYQVFSAKEPAARSKTLTSAYRFYCEKELGDSAHSALPDATAALEVLQAQLKRYDSSVEELAGPKKDPNWLDEAGKVKKTEAGVVLNFGKHKDTLISRIPRSYLSWLLKSDFPSDTKKAIKDVIRA